MPECENSKQMVLKDRINENDQYKITDKPMIQTIKEKKKPKESNYEGDADDVKEDGVPHAQGLAVLETS
jgi:hypothetical protein